MVTFDATVFPANAALVQEATKTMAAVTAMSPQSCAFVLYPMFQQQTSINALTKHKHGLELSFLKHKMSLLGTTMCLYSKPDASAADKRALSQTALVSWHNGFDTDAAFLQSNAVREGKLGPIPLLKVSDFLGFNEEVRPGASARVEQCPVSEIRISLQF